MDLSASWTRDGTTRLRSASKCERVSGKTIFENSTAASATQRFVLEQDHQVCALASTFRADMSVDLGLSNPIDQTFPRAFPNDSGAFVVVKKIVVADFVSPSHVGTIAARLLAAVGPRQAIETGTHYATTCVKIPASHHPHVSPMSYLQHITWSLPPYGSEKKPLPSEIHAIECGFKPYCFENTEENSALVLFVWTNPVV